MHSKPKNDLTGMRFTGWKVLGWIRRAHAGHPFVWLCSCDCGVEKYIRSDALVSGSSTSCGCLGNQRKSDLYKTHGLSWTGAYKSWYKMLRRCNEKDDHDYHNYGGRGITVCERWLRFENFLEDMGERPPNHTVDRIKNDGNYEPGNCRWATKKEQGNNRRTNIIITFNGCTGTITELARKVGIKPGVVIGRIRKRGWSIERALTTPTAKSLPNNQKRKESYDNVFKEFSNQ